MILIIPVALVSFRITAAWHSPIILYDGLGSYIPVALVSIRITGAWHSLIILYDGLGSYHFPLSFVIN